MTIENRVMNGKEYTIELTPFDDRSPQNEDGTYEFIYEGSNVVIRCDDRIFTARKYNDDDHVSFMDSEIEYADSELADLKELMGDIFSVTKFQKLSQNSNSAYIEI